MREPVMKRLELLEKKRSLENKPNMVMLKGFWVVLDDPEKCRSQPEPYANICSWAPAANVKAWDATNWHLLPCSNCDHFGETCKGYDSLHINLESILCARVEDSQKDV